MFFLQHLRLLAITCGCFFCLIVANVSAAPRITIAVIEDGAFAQAQNLAPLFREEIRALLAGEFEVQFKPFSAQWSVQGVNQALNSAYSDPQVDMVVVVGFATTQIVVRRGAYTKPTFLPLLFNADLLGIASKGNSSGIRNLNYVTDTTPLAEDLAGLKQLAEFDSAVLISDLLVLQAIEHLEHAIFQSAGTRIALLPYEQGDVDLADKIPPDTQAVLVGPIARMADDDRIRFFAKVTERGLPSFSFVGVSDVRLGALASDAPERDLTRVARLTALNMQAVLLGGRTEDQPVHMQDKRVLTINMDTARALGISPRFDVLSEAVLINPEAQAQGEVVDFKRVAELALRNSLAIQAERLDVGIGAQSVREARAGLLPQLNIGLTHAQRKSSDVLRGLAAPETGTDAALTLDQTLYSEAQVSGYQQQKLQQVARRESLAAAELDEVATALRAYLQAMRAEIQLKIQQDNLQLSRTNLEFARDRLQVGSSSAADVYRWESNVANARSTVLAANASLQQAHENLNRILSLPSEQRLQLVPSNPTDVFSMSEAEFNVLAASPRDYLWLAEYSVNDALRRSPELAALDAQVASAERGLLAAQRSHWVPDVSLRLQYTDNLNRSGIGAGPPIEGRDDWSAVVSASLPLVSGGRQRAGEAKARLQLDQLKLRRQQQREALIQQVRSSLYAAQASYANIELSRIAAEASRKNLALVSDGYRKGREKVIDLLDAQNQLLQADLAANNSVHDFLLDVISLQRASGAFDVLMSPSEQAQANQTMRAFIADKNRALRMPPVSQDPAGDGVGQEPNAESLR